MQFQIEIINVNAVTKPTAKGSYIMLDVAYKNQSTGKIEGKKIMSFVDKELYNVMSKASMGQSFTITSEKKPAKDGNEYWTWILAEPVGASTTAETPVAAKAGFVSPKSTYETSEERAARQVLIVRQSSLSNAIELLQNEKKPPTTEDVLRLADTFVNWVFQKGINLTQSKESSTSWEDMEDDIPV
jgi:hypothetical protein